MNYTIKIGGEAGQGLQTVGTLLSGVFAKAGYHVFSHQDYESRIRGGHNFYQIRVSDRPVASPSETVDVIVALDVQSIDLHGRELAEGGVILYDAESLKKVFDGPSLINVPFRRLASEKGGDPVMANSAAVGAVLAGWEQERLIEIFAGLLARRFGKKGEAVVAGNIGAARAGYGYAKEHCARCRFLLGGPSGEKILLTGSEAIALGALLSGVKFYAAYPMTPSTGIMNFLASKAEKCGIIVEQAEDEIAAINMALGASFSGVRAMTGTSGGGFALMVEGISLAGMTETPVVVALGQRPGPATGLPTRTEQGDLLFALHAGHGEFPRAIFAPGDPKEAVALTNKAFDMAEKYQIPAIVLFDQHLADCEWTYDGLGADQIVYKDYRLRGEALASIADYKRHAFTESGVSPLGVPGDAACVVVTDSDEHDEEGHIAEDAATRVMMVQKRLMKKLAALKKEIRPPALYGPDGAEIVLACWGSAYGAVKEAVDALREQGRKAAMLHFSELYPLPEEGGYMGHLRGAAVSVCVEQNATGQFARLLRAETGFEFISKINRFDGRPFTAAGILKELLHVAP